MADPRVSDVPPVGLRRSSGAAGTITKIRLENFMCHSNLQIDFGDYVNFITGQNGSGKSAILTALCVAFGCRAKSTQRASTLKDFIKTDCNYAVIHVEMKNQGEDAFKPEVYGDLIILERKIAESSGSVVLKDHLGKKVASGREEIRELVEHFNIDVENPCVIMTQDKSREFLHSGSNKDKFKFFFKATLLQQVDDLLQKIRKLLESANDLVCELEKSIEPILRELKELRGKIKSLEHVEQITEQAKQLKKKLAWSWVYDVDKQLQEQSAKLEKLKNNVPVCHARIDKSIKIHQDLKDSFVKKKAESDKLLEKTSEVEIMKNELKQNLSMVTRERLQLEGEHGRRTKEIQKMARHLETLQEQVGDIQEQHMKNTQAEDFEMEEKLRELQDQFDAANSFLLSLKEEENSVSAILSVRTNEIKEIADEVDGYERRLREISSGIREIQQHRTNKVTAFGGERVIQLLRVVERDHQKFKRAPIGPIGGHVNLLNGDAWGFAVENAIGRLLNAFIVTDHKDSLLLRKCAKEAHYEYLQIFIYDFSKPRLNIPDDMLPRTEHLTVLSVLHSENPTVMNVLVDMGNAERQVLVKDYEIGKKVAFGQRIPNLKEVYTIDGYRMFSRGSVQTILPRNKRARTGRLCSSYDVQVMELNSEASSFREKIQQACHKKRVADDEINKIRDNLQCIKRRRLIAERDCTNKKIAVQDQKKSLAAEASSASAPSVDELHGDISRTEGEIQEKEIMLEKYLQQLRDTEEKQKSLRASLMKLCESAKEESDALEKVTNELSAIQQEMSTAEKNKAHYEDLLSRKLLPNIKEGEEEYHKLEKLRQESCEKASYICPESEVEAVGGCKESTPEQLSAQLTRLNQRLQHETQNSVDSIDDLRMLYDKKQKKIIRKQQTFEDFRQKLKACNEALVLRDDKFRRNATLLKRQLTWQFNGHLRKKGISGTIRVGYEEKTLSIEVKMPQDASSNVVRDTRGLSGGERSFSTLCFALALHEMTEAPFRAMDEFDVFMDAISRKISLDTLVDFALSQGSQWIFITPHDISMVKQDDRMKKQQMAAPRS